MSIADKITRLQTAKTNIATAITNKGGTVAQGDGFEDFATSIGGIPTASLQSSKSYSTNANGTFTITPDPNYDGMEEVALTVAIPTYSDLS